MGVITARDYAQRDNTIAIRIMVSRVLDLSAQAAAKWFVLLISCAMNRDSDERKEKRQEKIGLLILGTMVVGFASLGVYGVAVDDGPLQILAFCGGIPTLFGFLIQLTMHFSS
jgi:hypothetical protein